MVAEVDGLTHLGVGLIDGLASLRPRNLNKLTSARRQDIADTVQGGGALLRSQSLPGVRGARARLDESINRFVRSQGLLADTHRLDTPRRGRNCRSNVARPLPVGSQGRIRIRLGSEGTMCALGETPPLGGNTPLAFSKTVLAAIGNGYAIVRINVGKRGKETIALTSEHILIGSDVKDAGHEVFRRGVLFEAAHQVGDRNIELTGVDDWDIQKKRADIAAYDLLDAGRHTGEHLELNAVLDAARSAQLVCEGNVENILSGHTQSDRAGTLRCHRPTEHALVVRVGRLFRRPGGELPAVNLRVHPLHGQVRALDDTDFDT